MVAKKLAGCSIVAAGKWKDEWTADKMKSWIEHAGGRFQASTLAEETTHLVVSPKAWADEHKHVQRAIEMQAAGHKVLIVKYEWLDETLNLEAKSKRAEKQYLWTTPGQASNHKLGNAGKSAEGNPTLASVLRDHTSHVVDVEEVEKAARTKEIADEAARKEREEEVKRREKDKSATKDPAIEHLFRKGSKKAEQDILSKGYHIHENNGFRYDVILTKIDMAVNRNERYTIKLQLYESDAVPHTYAVHGEFAATQTLPESKVLSAIGANWETAFRVFRQCFKDKTKIEWEDRVKFYDERARRQQERRLLGQNGLTKKGGYTEEFFASFDDFATAPYLYRPPQDGPRGLLPEVVLSTAGAVPEVSPTDGEHYPQEKKGPGASQATPLNGAPTTQDTHPVDLTKEPGSVEDPSSVTNQAASEVNPFNYACGELPVESNGDTIPTEEIEHTSGAKRKSDAFATGDNVKKAKPTAEPSDAVNSSSNTAAEDHSEEPITAKDQSKEPTADPVKKA